MMSRAVATRSGSISDLPTALPCAARNVLAIAPPLISTSTLSRRLPSRSSLGATLAPPLGALRRLGQGVGLCLHRAAGNGRQHVAETLGRRMRAMGDRERVVDP